MRQGDSEARVFFPFFKIGLLLYIKSGDGMVRCNAYDDIFWYWI